MKTIKILNVLVLCFIPLVVIGQTKNNEIDTDYLDSIQKNQIRIDKQLDTLSKTSNDNRLHIYILSERNDALCKSIDSIKVICKKLQDAQTKDRVIIDNKLQDTNNIVTSYQSIVEIRTFWGGVICFVIIITLLSIFYCLKKRIKQENFSIDKVRKAQEILQTTQTKMQEESVKLDNRMIELFERQISSTVLTTERKTDHTLALKVADEIVRIEMNLSHMDSSIKGYKQLAKAVQRIKDNFNANGYEIVDMLGKPYMVGMKAAVTFITDDSLERGQQIVTKIIKPQINYHQQMIQAAQIEVSQSE